MAYANQSKILVGSEDHPVHRCVFTPIFVYTKWFDYWKAIQGSTAHWESVTTGVHAEGFGRFPLPRLGVETSGSGRFIRGTDYLVSVGYEETRSLGIL